MSIESLYREESGRILATLIRLVGDFDLAEEVMHDAFAAALEQWSGHGVPDQPRAWLVATAKHKAIDRLRRDARFQERRDELAHWAALEEGAAPDFAEARDGPIADDRLRLVFTCCHPALSLDARVALTLRTLGGLTTEEIARAFLVPVSTMAQRLVRAKQKIRLAGIPYVSLRTRSWPSGSTAFSRRSTSSSTRAMRRPPGRSWSARTCAPRRSA